MKKIIMTLCTALILGGCQAPPQETGQQEQKSPEENETAETEETASQNSVIWVKEPSMKLDSIASTEAFPYILGASVEYTGYPAEWSEMTDAEGGYDIPDYRTDAVIAARNRKYGIMDYEGNVLFPFVAENYYETSNLPAVIYQPYTGFIYWTANDRAALFSADFTKTETVQTGGLGGWAPSPYIKNHEVWIDDPQTMESFPYENSFGMRIMASVVNDNGDETGCAVIDRDTSILMESEYFGNAFINGFVRVSENSGWDKPGRVGFVSAEGKDITGGPVYEEAGYFVDGYAPVKTGGKWAYIDEEGRQVSEALFTSASNVNKGRAYVELDGLWGILDLAATLEKGIEITAETCAGDYHEEVLDEPEAPAAGKTGTVKILVTNLNSRSIPSTSGEKMGKVAAGDIYTVLEIKEAEGYTWYRIGDGRWIADNGSWVEYSE